MKKFIITAVAVGSRSARHGFGRSPGYNGPGVLVRPSAPRTERTAFWAARASYDLGQGASGARTTALGHSIYG